MHTTLFLLSLVTAALLAACTPADRPVSSGKASHERSPVRICTGTSYSILPAIAQKSGLFEKAGINVEIKQFAIGRNALEAMLDGKCDMATAADTPLAEYGSSGNDIRILAGIASSDNLSGIVALRERGISSFPDLRGKTIGIPKGTAPHYFLDMILNRNNLQEKDIRPRFMKGEELNRAIAEGTVDAITTTDMNILKINEKMGDRVNILTAPGFSLNHGYLVTRTAYIASNEDRLKPALKALIEAESFCINKPAEAKRIFKEYLNISAEATEKLWSHIRPGVSLQPSMVMTLEDNARWLRESSLPDLPHRSFRPVIHEKTLAELAPAKVLLKKTVSP